MADDDSAKLTPEQLASLVALMYAGRQRPDPEIAFSEALALAHETLRILRNDAMHSAKPGDRREVLEALIAYMEESGKGATEIGRALGCNRATVTLWRAGKGRPSKQTSAKIAKFLAENSPTPNSPA